MAPLVPGLAGMAPDSAESIRVTPFGGAALSQQPVHDLCVQNRPAPGEGISTLMNFGRELKIGQLPPYIITHDMVTSVHLITLTQRRSNGAPKIYIYIL